MRFCAKGFPTNVDDHSEFARIVSILFDSNIKDENKLYAELNRAIPKEPFQKQRFTSAVRVMLAMIFAYGGVETNGDNADKIRVATPGCNTNTLVRSLAKYCVGTVLRRPAVYTKHIEAGKNPVQAFGLAIEDAVFRMPERKSVLHPVKEKRPFLGCKFKDEDYTYRADNNETPKRRWERILLSK